MLTDEILKAATERPVEVFNDGGGAVFVRGLACHPKDADNLLCVPLGRTPEEHKANAELICRAVNSFEAMRGALSGLLECPDIAEARMAATSVKDYGFDDKGVRRVAAPVLKARDALKLASGEA